MIDRGTGIPIVLIPGIQGRWEWMGPAVDALADRGRVITGSLPGDSGAIGAIDAAAGFDSYIAWLDELLTRADLERAALCGVSYGGWIALHYAAARPERVTTLTLASTPSPTWQPSCRVEWYLRAPRMLSPAFALSSPFRLYPEIAAAFPNLGARARFVASHLGRVARAPFGPTRMAERVRIAGHVDLAADCGRVTAPTQVVTGVPVLDRVVSVRSTREYLDAIAGARYDQIDRTGHIGLVTRPNRFADIVTRFAKSNHSRPGARLQVPA